MSWRVLAVDDDPDIGRQVKQILEAVRSKGRIVFSVDTTQNFNEGLLRLESSLYDLIILDVFKGKAQIGVQERPGADLLEAIKQRCFVPVIFYTALPASVKEHESDLVSVVHKTSGGMAQLKKAAASFIEAGLPLVNRKMINYFFQVQAEYMWKFVQPNWKKITKTADAKSLAYLLARRLAVSLSRDNIHQLISSLGQSAADRQAPDTVHPAEYYIHPSLGEHSSAGDIFKRRGATKTYHIILTPSCDMFTSPTRKANSDYVLLAECIPLKETVEWKEWKAKNSTEKKNVLKALMTNKKKDRHYFLPGTFFLPSLCVDFQKVQAIPFQELNKKFERITTLDSPFAECLLNKFCRYMGRVGTLDLSDADLESIANN